MQRYKPSNGKQRLVAAIQTNRLCIATWTWPQLPFSLPPRGNDTRTCYEMADAARIGRVAGSRAHTALVSAGLLAWTRIGPRRVFRLTRWGEDWLLAIGRCEVPPARPVG